jgi:hypothetical protein
MLRDNHFGHDSRLFTRHTGDIMTFNNIFSLTQIEFDFLASLPDPKYGRFHYYQGLDQHVDSVPYLSGFIFPDYASHTPTLATAINLLRSGAARYGDITMLKMRLLHGTNLFRERAEIGHTIDKDWFKAYNRVAFQILANQETLRPSCFGMGFSTPVHLVIYKPSVIQKP